MPIVGSRALDVSRIPRRGVRQPGRSDPLLTFCVARDELN